MTLGLSLGLSLLATAMGAILKFAVHANTAGIDLGTVGVILMAIGAVGLAIGLWLLLSGRVSADESS